MKALVIYYSLENNTKFLAETIAKTLDADTLELKTKKKIKPKNILKYIKGGMGVMFKKKPELEPYEINLDKYNLIFVGSPVWVGSYAPPLRTFFSEQKPQDQNFAFFASYGGNHANVFENLKSLIPGNKFLGEISFQEPLGDTLQYKEAVGNQISKWAKDIKEKCSQLANNH